MYAMYVCIYAYSVAGNQGCSFSGPAEGGRGGDWRRLLRGKVPVGDRRRRSVRRPGEGHPRNEQVRIRRNKEVIVITY